MKSLSVNLMLLLASCSVFGQTFPPMDNAGKSYNYLKIGKFIWIATNDTAGVSATAYPGAIVYRQQSGDTAHYRSNGVKWAKLASTDIPSIAGLQDSITSQNLQRVTDKGNTTTNDITLDAGGIAGRLRLNTSTSSINRIFSQTTGATAFRPLGLAAGGTIVSDYAGTLPAWDGSSSLQVRGISTADTAIGISGLGVGYNWRLQNFSGGLIFNNTNTGAAPLYLYGSGGISVDGGILLENGNFSMNMGGTIAPRFLEFTNFNNANQFGIPARTKFLMYDTVSSRAKLIPIGEIVGAESGVEYSTGKVRLGTNPLLANTTLPLTGYSLTLTGDGSATSTESNPFYLHKVVDNRVGPTSTSVTNTNTLGIATLALFNDKSAGVLGINGSAVLPSMANGTMPPNHVYLDAGVGTRGIVLQYGTPDSGRVLIKDHTDTVAHINSTFSTFYKPMAVGGLFDLTQNRAADYLAPYMLETIGTDGTKAQFAITQYSNDEGGMSFHSRKSRGTQLNPLAIVKGDRLYSMGARGYDGEKFSGSPVAMIAEAAEDFTPTANGSMLKLEVSPLGSYDGGRVVGLWLMADGKARMNSRISLQDMLFGGISATAFMEFRDKDSLRTGYMGDASASNKNIYLVSDDEEVIIKSGAAAQVTVSDAGTTLNSNGSFAAGYREISSTTTLTKTDYTALITSSSAVITLPAASSCPNRMYRLVNYGTGGNITISTVFRDAASTTTLPNNSKWLIQSDGSNWLVIAD